jgi:hypothetical protein
MNQLNLEQALSTARKAELPASPGALQPAKPAWLAAAVGILAIGIMFWTHPPGARDCRVTPLPMVFGFSTEISVTMPAGVPCTIAVQPGGSVRQLTIDAEPENGTVAARGRTGVIYRPHPKFKGEDHFSFSLAGGSSALHDVSAIHVRAVVK